QAISTGYGSAERSSTTLGEVMLYQAVRLADGSVVRIAEGEAGYLAILGTLSLPVVLMVVGGAVVAVVVAR
ncbi:two-component sensor histidine kinase, partial [Bittarella massiliensis]|nr:two-component sensor histidine kinase [Bittarella massiliensis (ex Durand et al. 2017)]